MPIRHPPRREPRVLAVTLERGQLAWCAADPWELRSSGTVAVSAGTTAAVLRRLVRREKPTALSAASPRLTAPLAAIARSLRVPVLAVTVRPLDIAAASALYPELALYAPTRPLRTVALLALGAVLEAAVPTRPYATPRHRTVPLAA